MFFVLCRQCKGREGSCFESMYLEISKWAIHVRWPVIFTKITCCLSFSSKQVRCRASGLVELQILSEWKKDS